MISLSIAFLCGAVALWILWRASAGTAPRKGGAADELAMFRQIAASLTDVLWVLDLETRALQYVSPGASQTLQLPDGTLRHADDWISRVHPDDREAYTVAFTHARLTGTFEREYRLRNGRDEYRWIHDRAFAVARADGVQTHLVGLAQDVTLCREETDALAFVAAVTRVLGGSMDHRTGLEALATLSLEHLADACAVGLAHDSRRFEWMVVAHRDGNAQEAWREWLVQSATGALAQGLHGDAPGVVPLAHQDHADVVTLQGAPVAIALVAPLIVTGRWLGVMIWARQDPARAFSDRERQMATDVAERAALALERARVFQESEDVHRLEDEFLGTVSHELRTPLNAILGWAELLQTGSLDEAQRARALHAISANARRQAYLIQELLDLSRASAGTIDLDLQRHNVRDVVMAAVEIAEPDALGNNVRVTARPGPPVMARVDASRLQQVLRNVLGNAIKFSAAAGQLTIDVRRNGEWAEIEVSDTGRGISAEFLPYVFDAFRQEHTIASRARGGLGLGLNIVKRLVTMHGGTVDAFSEGEGRGSTFVVRLPIDASAPVPAPPRRSTGPAAASGDERGLAGVTVLVVDDDEDSRAVVAAMLASAGAEVLAADTAQAALDTLETRRADLLLTDLAMPGRDGFDLLRTLRHSRSASRDIPALAVTAHARESERQRALAEGFDAFVVKPIELNALTAAVRHVLGASP